MIGNFTALAAKITVVVLGIAVLVIVISYMIHDPKFQITEEYDPQSDRIKYVITRDLFPIAVAFDRDDAIRRMMRAKESGSKRTIMETR